MVKTTIYSQPWISLQKFLIFSRHTGTVSDPSFGISVHIFLFIYRNIFVTNTIFLLPCFLYKSVVPEGFQVYPDWSIDSIHHDLIFIYNLVEWVSLLPVLNFVLKGLWVSPLVLWFSTMWTLGIVSLLPNLINVETIITIDN